MRGLIAAIAAAVLIAACSWGYTSRIQSVTDELTQINGELRAAINADDMPRASAAAEDMRESITRAEGFLSAFGSHEDIETLRRYLEECAAYAEFGDRAGAYAASGMLGVCIDHIGHKYELTFANVL